MKRKIWIPMSFAILLLAACEDNPGLTDPRLEQYSAELTLSSGHVHILSELGFTVTIKNGLGHTATGFDAVTLERLAVGSTTWRTASELALQGRQWVGAYTFTSSGDYRLRLMVTHLGSTTPIEVPFMDPEVAMLHAVRAHAEVGGVRIEFENFPGHVHEGDEVMARFWVMEQERDANGIRQPISGFEGTIVCDDPGGFSESHDPVEVDPGVYEALHTWTGAGEGRAVFRLPSGEEASFVFHVVHAH